MPKKRTVTKSQGGIIAALFTVLILIFGAFAALAGYDVGGIGGAEAPADDAASPCLRYLRLRRLSSRMHRQVPPSLSVSLLHLAVGGKCISPTRSNTMIQM